MGYKYKTVKGNSTISATPFFTGKIQNERILSKKETYAYLVDEVGGKRADHSAAWKGLMKAIALNAETGKSARIDGLGIFRNYVKGSFEGSKGPWVPGKNMLVIGCFELDEFKNALKGVSAVNDVQGDKPEINSVLNLALDEYDVVRIGDTLSIGGANLAPDAEREDEFVALYRDETRVATATVTRSELGTVECKFESAAPEPGEYRLVVFTRCGSSDEDTGVKSASRIVKFK